jgi:hypothetical protein
MDELTKAQAPMHDARKTQIPTILAKWSEE